MTRAVLGVVGHVEELADPERLPPAIVCSSQSTTDVWSSSRPRPVEVSNVVGKPAASTTRSSIFCQARLDVARLSSSEYGSPSKKPSGSVPLASRLRRSSSFSPSSARAGSSSWPLVDELASPLADLAFGERSAERPAAPADPLRRLEHLRRVTRLASARTRSSARPVRRRRRRPSAPRRPASGAALRPNAVSAQRGRARLLHEARAGRPALFGRDGRDRPPGRRPRAVCVPCLPLPSELRADDDPLGGERQCPRRPESSLLVWTGWRTR